MFKSFDKSHKNRIILQDIDPKALDRLLDFLYTSEIQVSEQNAQVLLNISGYSWSWLILS